VFDREIVFSRGERAENEFTAFVRESAAKDAVCPSDAYEHASQGLVADGIDDRSSNSTTRRFGGWTDARARHRREEKPITEGKGASGTHRHAVTDMTARKRRKGACGGSA